MPVGDTAAQIKANEEARAAVEASPEGQARQCFDRANLVLAHTHPPPDTETDHTQRDAVTALKNKCRADSGLPPISRATGINPPVPESTFGHGHVLHYQGRRSCDLDEH
jgi:hypothetical protein